MQRLAVGSCLHAKTTVTQLQQQHQFSLQQRLIAAAQQQRMQGRAAGNCSRSCSSHSSSRRNRVVAQNCDGSINMTSPSDDITNITHEGAAAADSQLNSTLSTHIGSSSSSKSGVIKQSSSSSGLVVNKEPISSSMSPELYSYLLSHTRESHVLAELRKETAGMHGGHMQIAPEQGQLLVLLVELLGVRSAIEVGVFTGYSSLAVALALPPDGRLVAFDRDAKTMEIAQRYWEKAGVADRIDSRLGPALDGLQELLQQEGENTFDMAFIDADKRGYQGYFDLCLKLVRRGGLIAVDNVLFYGKVADPAAQDKATTALKQFNDALMADDRVTFSIVPIGDGMALCRKR